MSEAQIEQMAKAAFEFDWPKDKWERLGPGYHQDRYKGMIRAALTAAPVSAAEPLADFTEWERSQIASWAAGNAMTYMQHSVIGKGLNDHEKVQMENWKALHDKLKRT